ncbi:hypothetical protein EZV62_018749 [Acer yangbiense]|uniref:Armadillo-like repeats domain-containing protein n=1 Tax=Acer yangbiense TaxID=1000413 RepID=A0A5C7HMC3_9ROSI|nr:hypothetical protein EZV62_018749 [Acer yangbiense]
MDAQARRESAFSRQIEREEGKQQRINSPLVSNLKASAAVKSQSQPQPRVESSKTEVSSESSKKLPENQSSSVLPSDFFDNADKKKPKTGSGVLTLANQKDGLSDKIQPGGEVEEKPMAEVADSETKQTKGALPEGFFDNKEADLRARGIKIVKPDVKNLKKLIQEDLQEVDDRMEEDEIDAAEVIEEYELLEQKTSLEKVEMAKEEENGIGGWQEKALDLVEFTGSVTQALPGPRVGQSKLPWILAVPLAYLGVTFVVAFVKTVKKFNSPKFKRRKLVNKNAMLCKAIDELFQRGKDAVEPSALKELVEKTGFSMEDVLRKYIRYALNEKPFNPELVVNLIQLRKATTLEHTQVAEILNDISRRIVREKGPVVLNISGYSERGFKRKLAVQALFGKVSIYLSEDADKLRLHTLSEAGDMDSLEKMINDSDSEDAGEDVVEGSQDAP